MVFPNRFMSVQWFLVVSAKWPPSRGQRISGPNRQEKKGSWGWNFCLLICACSVAQSCPTLCDPMDCVAHQPPLSMEFSRQEYWSGLPFISRVSSWPRGQMCFSCVSFIGRHTLYNWTIWEVLLSSANCISNVHYLWLVSEPFRQYRQGISSSQILLDTTGVTCRAILSLPQLLVLCFVSYRTIWSSVGLADAYHRKLWIYNTNEYTKYMHIV